MIDIQNMPAGMEPIPAALDPQKALTLDAPGGDLQRLFKTVLNDHLSAAAATYWMTVPGAQNMLAEQVSSVWNKCRAELEAEEQATPAPGAGAASADPQLLPMDLISSVHAGSGIVHIRLNARFAPGISLTITRDEGRVVILIECTKSLPLLAASVSNMAQLLSERLGEDVTLKVRSGSGPQEQAVEAVQTCR